MTETTTINTYNDETDEYVTISLRHPAGLDQEFLEDLVDGISPSVRRSTIQCGRLGGAWTLEMVGVRGTHWTLHKGIVR